jgi:HlyD family secretion protein
MKSMLRAFTVIILGASSLAGCDQAGDQEWLLGYIEADWVYVAAPQPGWVLERPVAPGTRVTRGDLLFRLDADAENAALAEAMASAREADALARDLATGLRPAEIEVLEAKLREAEARLERVRVERDRIVPLASKGLEPLSRADQLEADLDVAVAQVETLSKELLAARDAARVALRDAAAARVEAASAAVAGATHQLEQRTIRSTVDGQVEDVFLEAGEFATTGAPVLAVLPDAGLRVRFFVPQAELARIRVGGTVDVRADGLNESLTATITFIATDPEFTPPVIYTRESRQKLVFAVDARVGPGSGLLPGLPVEVRL